MATLIVVQDIVWSPDKSRGGHSMCILQWLKGFERLGHRAIFLDFINYSGGRVPYQREQLERFDRVIREWWRPENTALIDSHTGKSVYGLSADEVSSAAKHAAAMITIAIPGWGDPTVLAQDLRPRILVEHDPAYTHLWAAIKSPQEIFGVHDVYFTVGGNVGTDRCRVPTHGIDWKPIWNPVVLDWWPVNAPVTRDRFTTIADWWGQGWVEYEGALLGPKAEQFKRFIDVPRLAGESTEIALDINPDSPDIDLLKSHGWTLEDPQVVSDPASYRAYVSGSAGEFSCAKGVYAGTHCGWFSDRSSCYLAAGRPVVVQATGFENLLPTGEGLFAVSSAEEAAEAMKAIRADYAAHSAAARRIAAAHFDSDRIVDALLRGAGV